MLLSSRVQKNIRKLPTTSAAAANVATLASATILEVLLKLKDSCHPASSECFAFALFAFSCGTITMLCSVAVIRAAFVQINCFQINMCV